METLLLSLHSMAAAALSNPLLEIDAEEAGQIAKAASRVARHYDLKASAVATDWVALVMALMTVYGTRVLAMRNLAAQNKAAKPGSNIVPIMGG